MLLDPSEASLPHPFFLTQNLDANAQTLMPSEIIPLQDVRCALFGMPEVKPLALGAVSLGSVMVSSSGKAPG